ncbi:predicted protein [Histoplasma capsulatum var. duboisii H88]|uniref:Predicted protein n=1 Tax=Ajellomyces capsulatus (strain H88) TaxID=544711 RepID=F0UL80_AJEC8|nr:predicted protein [Histoplasma capsulatum var. duboisii H88]
MRGRNKQGGATAPNANFDEGSNSAIDAERVSPPFCEVLKCIAKDDKNSDSLRTEDREVAVPPQNHQILGDIHFGETTLPPPPLYVVPDDIANDPGYRTFPHSSPRKWAISQISQPAPAQIAPVHPDTQPVLGENSKSMSDSLWISTAREQGSISNSSKIPSERMNSLTLTSERGDIRVLVSLSSR